MAGNEQKKQTVPKRRPAQPVNKSGARLDRLEALLGQSVQAIAKQQEQIETLVKVSAVSKEESTQSHVPPSDDAEQKEARPPGYNPEEESEDNKPSADSDTKTATDTTPTEGAFTKAQFEEALDKALKEKVPKLVKAHTPRPYGWTEEMENINRDPVAFVRKAIEHDREACGGAFTTSEGYFGYKSGRGNDDARRSTALFLQKAFYGKGGEN